MPGCNCRYYSDAYRMSTLALGAILSLLLSLSLMNCLHLFLFTYFMVCTGVEAKD